MAFTDGCIDRLVAMDFGSSHVYLVKPGGPSIPDINVASGTQQESAEARYV